MSPTKTPTVGLPENPPNETIDFVAGMGQSRTVEWPIGTPDEIRTQFDAMLAEAEAGNNTQALTYRNSGGRASLVAKFGRAEDGDSPVPGATLVEELYAVDVLKDITEAPYFSSLTDEQVAWVRYCAENRLTIAEIDATVAELGLSASLEHGSWSALMLTLFKHLIHGVESYYETGFVLRVTYHSIRSANVKASFAGINTVVAAPTLSSRMNNLILALPSGEWLYKPPQAEHVGRGRWRVSREWHWALKWSVVYGGTLFAPA
jgi:hypothetical protein